ncbi:hypothetical protein [Collimonas humicola]|uniref:hypothetical protein n=1 Tax=Collimonas humicola TaxID=2825886 RepID=UPI001E37B5E1|nr:hypothetical protein [Collimonas humicola]
MLIAGLRGKCSDTRFDVTPAAWLRLVKYLGQFDSDPSLARPGKLAGMHQLEIAIALTSGTARLLDNWPHNFHALLARARGAFPLTTSINQAFGSLYRAIYCDLDEPHFDFLRIAFEDYLHDHWFGLLGRRNRRLDPLTIAAHPQKSLHAMAKEVNTGKTIVRYLASAGVIRGSMVRHQSGRVTWAIPTDEMVRAKNCVDDGMSMRYAVAYLGISRHRVRELLDAGLLQVWVRRASGGSSNWLISRTSASYLASLGLMAQKIDHPASTCIELAKLLKTWRLRRDEFPALVRAIASMTIVPIGRSITTPGLGGVLLVVGEAHAWLDGYRATESTWMSVNCAAKMLGLKQQVAYELVARRLLVSETSQVGARKCCRIHKNAIEFFRLNFVSLAQIAIAHDKTARQMLATINVTPICGPLIDGARQYFYLRRDVESLLNGYPIFVSIPFQKGDMQ